MNDGPGPSSADPTPPGRSPPDGAGTEPSEPGSNGDATHDPTDDATDTADGGRAHDRHGLAGPPGEGHGQPPALPGSPPGSAPPRRTGVFVDSDSLRVHVGELLRTYLGGYQVDAWGNFTFTYEDARIFVTIPMSPIGPQVGIFSITNLELPLTPELSAFLLTTNHELGFGAFSYDRDNDAVWLRHTLLGTTLDAPELQAAVAAVASTAAHFDDQIRDRFGGRAFHDAPENVQEATKPPETTIPNAGGYL